MEQTCSNLEFLVKLIKFAPSQYTPSLLIFFGEFKLAIVNDWNQNDKGTKKKKKKI